MTMNSGVTIRLLPVTTYTFTGLGTGKSVNLILAQHIDVTTFTEAHFLFRYHAATVVAAGSLQAGVFADGWDFQDPTTSFFSSAAIATGTSIAATPSGAVLQVIPVSLNLGAGLAFARHLMLQLTFNQTTANSNLVAQVSCDLVLKGGDGGSNVGGPNSYMGYRVM